jgi:hypothetical protein
MYFGHIFPLAFPFLPWLFSPYSPLFYVQIHFLDIASIYDRKHILNLIICDQVTESSMTQFPYL